MLRLTSSKDFQRVRRDGRSWSHPLVVLIACRNEGAPSRIGITAASGMAGAVARNRAKRRLRAAVRLAETQIAAGWDIVLIARPALVNGQWPEILGALETLLRRGKLAQEVAP